MIKVSFKTSEGDAGIISLDEYIDHSRDTIRRSIEKHKTVDEYVADGFNYADLADDFKVAQEEARFMIELLTTGKARTSVIGIIEEAEIIA